MKFHQFIEKALYYISVPKCVYCAKRLDIDDKALCKECLYEYEKHKELNCSICSETYDKCACSNKYLSSHGVKTLFKVFRYKPDERTPSNALIYSLKEQNRRDIFRFCASELARSIKSSGLDLSNALITNIPRRKVSINKFGYDHAEKLAKEVSKILNIEYLSLLNSKSQKSQKETVGEERRLNVRFELKDDNLNLSGRRVLLIDDVVTTGASISYAAMLLRSLGARKVIGASLSIAFKDYNPPPNTDDRFFKKR